MKILILLTALTLIYNCGSAEVINNQTVDSVGTENITIDTSVSGDTINQNIPVDSTKQVNLIDSVITPKRKYLPGDHELFFMPTAYTLEKGDSYFTDYELFFLNFTHGITSTTHISFFTLFPIVSSFLETLTLGVKQNYIELDNFSSSLFGSITLKEGLYMVGNVVSVSSGRYSFHLGLSYANLTNEPGSNGQVLIMSGFKGDFSKSASFIIEYTNLAEALDHDFGGFLTFGIRFRSESMSWEIAGIRILTDTDSELFLIPLLKATIVF